ncbi:FtsQ-type POTRA domain-containing protein [Nostocoides sp. F2B08]|uniref:cell division protein FtsQ/DivIB n=1 Tax=Nostocoides sp. F2B08 TaxID=2653936 RepID=UPI0012639DCC|nr:FtsQ-type POTRA domain-containing protein [Tetrasphaera sp. F2B08]KAB7741057.1 FtsQ-type POTRA domain-containing protein [Tetrasphaera sp. F2B08]
MAARTTIVGDRSGRASTSASTSASTAAAVTAQERFDRRIRARRRRAWQLGAALAVVTLMTVAGWWALWRSDWFLVESVVVTGVEERWEASIRAAAAVPMSQPLVEVDTSAAERSVSEVGIVREVRVVRSWPTTISIEVMPRLPVLAAQQPDGDVAVVDRDGAVIEVVPAAPENLPRVLAAGEAGASQDAYRSAWRVMSALPDGLLSQVTTATVSSADLVTLDLGDRTVVWGGPGDAELKASVVEALLDSGAQYVDVSAPRSPVTRETGDS